MNKEIEVMETAVESVANNGLTKGQKIGVLVVGTVLTGGAVLLARKFYKVYKTKKAAKATEVSK